MAKLVLAVEPTFRATARIPVPGRKPVPVEFVFRGRTRDEYREFLESIQGRDELDVLMDMIVGWDLDDPFDRENVAKLVQCYPGSVTPILETYVREVTGARVGN